jgi:hypothetical protein
MALPSTPLLDNFSRPDRTLVDDNWDAMDDAYSGSPSVVDRQITSNDSVSEGHRFWTRYTGANSEAWLEIAASAAFKQLFVWCRISGTGGTNAVDGYRLTVTPSTGDMALHRVTNASTVVQIASRTGGSFSAGDRILIQAFGRAISGYVILPSGGVIQVAGTDSTYTTGFLGVGLVGNGSSEIAARNFGGGTIDSLVAPAHPVSGFRVM